MNILRSIKSIYKKSYHRVTQSIAFYPTLISLLFVVLAIITISIENVSFIAAFKKELPYLIIQDTETARAVLSTVIGGILSLTVFSFSMVMVVLSQASSNFSPRLLPGLISDKKHQIILGFYIGTLLYAFITLIFLGTYGIQSESIGLSTTLSALWGVFCVVLFAYFIHTISNAIQISTIIQKIFEDSHLFLEKKLVHEKEYQITSINQNTEDWHIICSHKTGYYQKLDLTSLQHKIFQEENFIEILPYAGQHIYKGSAIFSVKNSLPVLAKEELLMATDFAADRLNGNRDVSGLIKLMEVAVKAMSPGVNDPGTAIDAISKVVQLLHYILTFSPKAIKKVANTELFVVSNYISPDELCRIILQPIREYSKADATVLYEFILGLQSILHNSKISKICKEPVKKELLTIKDMIQESIGNPLDRSRLLQLYKTNVADTPFNPKLAVT